MLTTQRPKKAEFEREWFRYQLRLKKSSFAQVAENLSISRSAVSQGILSPSERLAEQISKILGQPKKYLWPHKFRH